MSNNSDRSDDRPANEARTYRSRPDGSGQGDGNSSPHGRQRAPRRSAGARLALALGLLFAGFAGIVGLIGAFVVVLCVQRLPTLEVVTDYQPKIPMRIYSADHVLLGEFGEERREFIHLEDVPMPLREAVLAIEDDRFYAHGGVDYTGIARAIVANLTHGSRQGGSTITMQVARNFFLSSEKTYTRKAYEILLAMKIEAALSKDQILELYLNQIYLGQRAYGFAAAARVYFGKPLKDLSLPQMAMLAGLPKAPSTTNPITNPVRAEQRQRVVLKRMVDLGYIDQRGYDAALAAPLALRPAPTETRVEASYVLELIRQQMLARYPQDAYTRGYTVTTTLVAGDQEAANEAVRKAVDRYDGRVGPKQSATQTPATPRPPGVEAALIAITPQTGAIRAMVGGADFARNQFNHVTQAWRQPGSAFKPFIYAAALEHGIGPATLVDDGPFELVADKAGGKAWRPKNYGGTFGEQTPLRTALMKSRNLVTVRVMQQIGPREAQDYVARFGFDPQRNPAYLSTALGAGATTPLQLASAYAVLANGGYRVNPYLISEVTTNDGTVVLQAAPHVAGFNAPRVIPSGITYIIQDMLHDTATRGTAAGTNVLRRTDLAAKTGTTNDSRDTWFAGFQPSLVAVSWMGFDQPRSLGRRATGAGLALPIWNDYMAAALRGKPAESVPMPSDVTRLHGELYYDGKVPGAGFIASIPLPGATAFAGDTFAGAQSPPAAATDAERADVIRQFSADLLD
ncbi:penicillin-binding protein 1A [Robbsia andropogonis]|uniref:penicillin-binding protein 1A n=1 Tax=Robbsia andropogonis TaxID=28092 RepID=UPI003D1A2983